MDLTSHGLIHEAGAGFRHPSGCGMVFHHQTISASDHFDPLAHSVAKVSGSTDGYVWHAVLLSLQGAGGSKLVDLLKDRHTHICIYI